MTPFAVLLFFLLFLVSLFCSSSSFLFSMARCRFLAWSKFTRFRFRHQVSALASPSGVNRGRRFSHESVRNSTWLAYTCLSPVSPSYLSPRTCLLRFLLPLAARHMIRHLIFLARFSSSFFMFCSLLASKLA